MDFRIYCAMDAGPRDDQEDCLLLQGEAIQARQFEKVQEFSADTVEILAVCDGMGGLAAGEKASRFVCENLAKLAGEPGLPGDFGPALEKIQAAMENDCLEECGTTVAGLLIAPSGIQVFNLGDSRVYRVANGKIERRSYDHSFVQVLLEEGKITDREAFTHPYRNLITAGMGPAFSYKWAVETLHLQAEPITGDRAVYLICSDGVCDVLTDLEIERALADTPVANGPALMELVKAVSMKDNTSFMIVEIIP